MAFAFACDIPEFAGHIVVATRAHVSTVFQLEPTGQRAFWKLVDEVRNRLTTGILPAGVWIGMSTAIAEPGPEVHEQVHVVPGSPGEPPAISGLEWSYVASGEYQNQ